MARNVLSIGLTLLLFGSVLWGQCASCPLFKPATEQSHDCCHDEKTPAKRPVHDNCPNDAVTPVTYSKAGLDTTQLSSQVQAAVHAVAPAAPAPVLEPAIRQAAQTAFLHAPPDLCVLNSVFLV